MTESFMGIVCGFADTLPAIKEILPGLVNYNQSFIMQHVLGADYNAHNTVHDATSPQNGKIADSGLTMKHLQLAYSRWGTDGTQDQWPLLLS